METPNLLQKTDELNNGNVDITATATTSSNDVDSPKTPTRATFDDSFDDYDSDEMESPKFPHLIPIYNRRDADYDLKDVRIGWDDGCGSVFYEDDDYDTYRNGKRLKRSKRGRLFTDHRHRSLYGRNKFCNNSPSPSSNQAAIQAELNDYLGCILNCLSAKKRNRQLLKAKNEANSTANNSIENNNIKSLLDDSADDEMMLLCTQDVEKTIANDSANCENIKNNKNVIKSDFLSIVGISPLKDTNDNTNNNVYHHVSKKFKPIYNDHFDGKKNENIKLQCHTFTSNIDKNIQNNTAKNIYKDDSISLFNDSLTNDDDLFSSIDLSEIEQQISSDNKTISTSVTQKCTKQQSNIHIRKQNENKPVCTSTITSSSSSVLWRRSTSSSSIVNVQSLSQNKIACDVPETQINPSCSTKTTVTKYCTPAEIEEKRNRARRTLLLKFKSKNKTIS